MLHLANSLWHHKKLIKDDTDNLSVTFKEESDPIPFLVLEPAKREYRELSRYDIPELIILSPSASTKFPMRLNPFEFPKGLTLSEHISKLCQVLRVLFRLLHQLLLYWIKLSKVFIEHMVGIPMILTPGKRISDHVGII